MASIQIPQLLCLVCNSNINFDTLTDIFCVSLPHNGESLANFITKVLSTPACNLRSSYICTRCYNLFGMLEQAQQTVANIEGEILRIFQSCCNDELILNGSNNDTIKIKEVEDYVLEDEKSEQIRTENEEIFNSEPKLNCNDFCNTTDASGLEIPNSTVNIPGTNKSHVINDTKQSKLYNCKYNETNGVDNNFYTIEVDKSYETENISIVCDKLVEQNNIRDHQVTENWRNSQEVPSPQYTIPNNKTLDSNLPKFNSDEKSMKHTCPTCNKKWRTSSELKAHMRSHSNVRPFMCEKCGQAYKRKVALEIHVMMHNGVSPYRCDHCNKCFTQKGALQRHLPMHTGEMPYRCESCDKRFVHHTSYNMHVLSHTKQKSYRCDVCDLSLLSTSHLKRHMRVHTGEKPYSCEICQKSFAERYNLVAHQKIHDPLQISTKQSKSKKNQYKCKNCEESFSSKQSYHEHLKQHNTKFSRNVNVESEQNYNLNGAELLETCVNEVWQSLSKLDQKTES